MKTIFITCFTGLVSRNILSTDAFERLAAAPGVRIVIVVPESRIAALEREFGRENVIIVGTPTPSLRGRDRILWVIATNLLATETRRVQRIAKFAYDRSYAKYAVSWFLGLLGRIATVRRTFRAVFDWCSSPGELDSFFDRHQPSLLFATDVYTPYDVKFMRAARRRGVLTVGMVRSWDNVTSKTLLSFIPDTLVVHTEGIKAEAVRYGDVPRARITVVGIPHYDRYRSESRATREVFCAKLGLDPGKRLILFTPPSDNYLKKDPITPVALRALERLGAQILVRFPLVGDVELVGYERPPHVVFDAPGRSPDFTEVHLDRDADRHLADSIYHSDLVVTWASTMIIDAVVFDKPVVLIGFDAAPRPYGRSITRYYDYDHQRRIIELGGARLVRGPQELAAWCGRYLKDPKLDEEGRARTREEYCGALDAKAGERLAAYLIRALESVPSRTNVPGAP